MAILALLVVVFLVVAAVVMVIMIKVALIVLGVILAICFWGSYFFWDWALPKSDLVVPLTLLTGGGLFAIIFWLLSRIDAPETTSRLRPNPAGNNLALATASAQPSQFIKLAGLIGVSVAAGIGIGFFLWHKMAI